MKEMPSGEYPIQPELRPEKKLKSVRKMLMDRVKAHDFEIENLSFQRELETLEYALSKQELWAFDRLDGLEEAVNRYIAANNAERMDAMLDLKAQIQGIQIDMTRNAKKAS